MSMMTVVVLTVVPLLLLLLYSTYTVSFQARWAMLITDDARQSIRTRRRRKRSNNYKNKNEVFFCNSNCPTYYTSSLSLQLAAARRSDNSKLSKELQQIIEAEERREKEEEEKFKQKQIKLATEEKQLIFHDVTDSIEIIIPSQFDNTRIDLALDSLLPHYLQQQEDEEDEEEDTSTTCLTKLSRTQIASLIKEGYVCVTYAHNNNSDDHKSNNQEIITQKSFLVSTGQILWISRTAILNKLYYSSTSSTTIVPEHIPLSILYEDEYMIVVNKPAGLVVHPAVGNWNGTLVNALAFYFMHQSPFGPGELFVQDQNNNIRRSPYSFRPGIVHRLDKGTSGVIVVAKTTATLQALSEMFAQRKVKKTYVAVTVGNPGNRVVIDNYISRHPRDRQRMRVVPMKQQALFPSERKNNLSSSVTFSTTTEAGGGGGETSSGGKQVPLVGRRAISLVDTKAFDGKLAFVEVRIPTGRTHQIRVHLQDRGTPVYGDDTYGLMDWNKKLSKRYYGGNTTRPLLHAYQLELDHHPMLVSSSSLEGPTESDNNNSKSRKLIFRAPIPQDIALVTDSIWPQGRVERPDFFCPEE